MKNYIVTFLITMIVSATMNIFAASVDLSWKAPPITNSVSGYRVYYLRTPTNNIFSLTNTSMVLSAITYNCLSTNASVNNLSDGVIRFRVAAYNGDSTNLNMSVESDYSNEAITNILNKPSAPLLLRIDSVSPTN